jgi:hypothetical protein
MSGLTKLGLFFLLAGAILLGYQGITTLMGSDQMGSDVQWNNVTLADFVGGAEYGSDGGTSFSSVQGIKTFLVNLPLVLWFFGLAVLCFLLHALGKPS